MNVFRRTIALAMLVGMGFGLGPDISFSQTVSTQMIRIAPARTVQAEVLRDVPSVALPANVFAGEATVVASSTSDDPEATRKAQRLARIQQWTVDRRPSAILSAWSTPEEPVEEPQPEPADEAAPEPDPAVKLVAELADLDTTLTALKRHVALGNWDEVGTAIKTFEDDEAKALYRRLITTLPNTSMSGQPEMMQADFMDNTAMMASQAVRNIPPQFTERNTFTSKDLIGLGAITPEPLDDAALSALGRILRLAIQQGNSTEDVVESLEQDIGRPEDEAAFTRRQAARLLMAAGQAVEAGHFLPSIEEAEADDDREALNLLSRHYMALHAKEPKGEHLERAWTINQAVLAVGEVDKTQKDEALTRAVELATKVRDELGTGWLIESFTERPERGMEIIAAIGSAAARGLQSQPMNPEFRRKSLALQKTAVDALLEASPERAEPWRLSLELLASAWRTEAEFSRLYDTSTRRGPMMQRDSFGNLFYINSNEPMMPGMMGQPQNMPRPITIGEILKLRPGSAWMDLIGEALQPDFADTFARLHLKVNEEEEAFPYIERLAASNPEKARELAQEFLRVWTQNHDPNAQRNYTNPYMFMYGFERKAEGIPLTRSKQERNLRELAGWVKRINALPIRAVDEALLTRAFTASHSTAEVYRLEAIEDVFGSVDALEPKALAALIQQMRENLAGLWRQPATQEQGKTRRKEKDIQAEVLRGYELAGAVIEQALKRHPDQWALVQARAAILHDENNYRRELDPSSDFTPKRREALSEFRRAAGLYAKAALNLNQDEETTAVFDQWFYASLGACDLAMITKETQPVASEPSAIREAIESLPGESRQRHMDRFANSLFTRMSSLSPAVKFSYLRGGFAIVDDNDQAREARAVFDYYGDLVTEIKLDAQLDGSDVIGHERPFGLFVNLLHTREIEREAGGFARYLQNQNSGNSFYYNYGRPLENYRDKFEGMAREAFQEHFDVLSVTFQSESVGSRATEEYGWRSTSYAYLMLKARDPSVDRVPPLKLDLDFLDTSGYVILPVESPTIPVDATSEEVPPRPYSDLQVTQILDERQADRGKLILEIKAVAHGLVPELDEILNVDSEGFSIVETEDQGLAISKFDDSVDATPILSERTWLVSFEANPDLAEAPARFEFASAIVDDAELIYQRYDDADLAEATSIIDLRERYSQPSYARYWWGLGLVGLAGVTGFLAWRAWPRGQAAVSERFQIPDPVTPFTVLGLLRDIQQNNGLSESGHHDLAGSIQRLETHYFADANTGELDLRTVAEDWVRRTQ